MTTSYQAEFRTVDLILDSDAPTLAVDAFALSLIKAERQIRRLVTHLIFQFPRFDLADIEGLRGTLSRNSRVYFEGFERGFDALYPRSVRDLIGAEYDRLRGRLIQAIDYRNKIFHGQLTLDCLSREELLRLITDIREWCEALANGADAELGYDGFARDSFQKSNVLNLSGRLKIQLTSLESYAAFIRQHMQRQ